MQLGALISVNPSSVATTTVNDGGESAANDSNEFAQMLGDASAEEQGSQPAPRESALPERSSTALAAQEVDQPNREETDESEITAEAASDMLEQLEQVANDPLADKMLLKQLKDALLAIRDGGKPIKISALLQAIPALQPAIKTPEHAAQNRGVAQWLQAMVAAHKQKEASSQNVASDSAPDTAALSLVQSLQASIFRPVDDTASAEDTQARARDYIEIVPLSVTQATEAPAWVKNLAKSSGVREGIDAEIPSLALKDDGTLPDITLPQLDAEIDTTAADVRRDAFLDKLTPLNDNLNAKDITNASLAALQTESVAHKKASTLDQFSATDLNGTGVGSVAVPVETQAVHKATAVIAQPHVQNHAPVSEQVHVAITRGTREGLDSLTIQLEPGDLGRVEVKMHTASNGQTQLSFLVDKAETLDSLARDARGLERALQDAGVKADAGNMQFNLRQHPQFSAGDFNQGQSSKHSGDDGDADENATGPQAAAATTTKTYRLNIHDGVDIQA